MSFSRTLFHTGSQRNNLLSIHAQLPLVIKRYVLQSVSNIQKPWKSGGSQMVTKSN